MARMLPVVLLVVALVGANAKSTHDENNDDDGKRRPNILFILADDLGWDDVSFHGSNEIPTPNLDSLAYDGIQLANYYVQPLCSPTRAALMTGRYPIRSGLQNYVILSAAPFGLGLNETILPQYLKGLGYSTHIVGKWHQGFFEEAYFPTNRGFDSHFGIYQAYADFYTHNHKATSLDELPPKMTNGQGILSEGLDMHRNGKLDNSSYGIYATELFSTEIESIFDAHDKKKPMFMYFASQAVHTATHSGTYLDSLQAPQKYMDRVAYIQDPARQTYAAMMIALDDAVGNITKALHRNHMLENTIIVFSTDNGGAANGWAYNDASNYPLRGQKATIWEGGTRGVGFIWSPLLKKSGYTSHHLMHVTDWLPTLLTAAGYRGDFKAPLDGVDQWEALSENKPTKRNEILYNNSPMENCSAVRVGDYKILYDYRGLTYRCPNWYAPEMGVQVGRFCNQHVPSYNLERSDVQNGPPVEGGLYDVLHQLGRRKARKVPYVIDCGTPPEDVQTNCVPQVAPCLFNLATDPCEFRNLANELPDVLAALLARSHQLQAEAMTPTNRPVDPLGLPENHCGVWNWWSPQPSIPASCMPGYTAP